MSYIIAGLGNPGEEYEGTRHNTGRIVAAKLAASLELPEFKYDPKINAQIAKGKVGKTPLVVVLPEGLMNNSGKSLGHLVTSLKKAEQLVVVHDDLDLPLGKIKFSFNRSAGGHRGVESVIKNIKTEKFLRLRLGVCPTTPAGKLKKPVGEAVVVDFILKPFRPTEEADLKKMIKTAVAALETLLADGRDRAMNIYNS
jgi:PTH1 family peptidyl-tRNA hydrolase